MKIFTLLILITCAFVCSISCTPVVTQLDKREVFNLPPIQYIFNSPAGPHKYTGKCDDKEHIPALVAAYNKAEKTYDLVMNHLNKLDKADAVFLKWFVGKDDLDNEVTITQTLTFVKKVYKNIEYLNSARVKCDSLNQGDICKGKVFATTRVNKRCTQKSYISFCKSSFDAKEDVTNFGIILLILAITWIHELVHLVSGPWGSDIVVDVPELLYNPVRCQNGMTIQKVHNAANYEFYAAEVAKLPAQYYQ